jgi:integrase
LIAANPVRAVPKPKPKRERFVTPASPLAVERLRRVLLTNGRLRDATLVSVLAYAGLRPGEAIGLRWSDIGDRTLRIERAVALATVKATKNSRIRIVRLVPALRDDLAAWRSTISQASDAYVFPNRRGDPWSDDDWRNLRNRVFQPAALTTGITLSRPYDLRHSFASY